MFSTFALGEVQLNTQLQSKSYSQALHKRLLGGMPLGWKIAIAVERLSARYEDLIQPLLLL